MTRNQRPIRSRGLKTAVLAGLLGSVFVMSGCHGATEGALLGAWIGVLLGGTAESAGVGAAVGAGIGAVIDAEADRSAHHCACGGDYHYYRY